MALYGSKADFKVHEMKSMGKSRDAEAVDLLKRISHQVQPIMRRREWRVPLLSEFFPANPNLLGLNIGGGGGRTREIKVRLRPARDPDSFLPYESVLGTMLHELVHNVRGPHDGRPPLPCPSLRPTHEFPAPYHHHHNRRRRTPYTTTTATTAIDNYNRLQQPTIITDRPATNDGRISAFYKLLDEITAECEELMSRGVGGTGVGFDGPSCGRLGAYAFIPRHNPDPGRLRDVALKAAEERAKRQRIMPTGPRRLGGGDGDGGEGAGLKHRYLTPAEAAAAAAERRFRDNLWCPCERLAGAVERAVAEAEAARRQQQQQRQPAAAAQVAGPDTFSSGDPGGGAAGEGAAAAGASGPSFAGGSSARAPSGSAAALPPTRPPPTAAELEADLIRRIEDGVIDLTLEDSDSEPSDVEPERGGRGPGAGAPPAALSAAAAAAATTAAAASGSAAAGASGDGLRGGGASWPRTAMDARWGPGSTAAPAPGGFGGPSAPAALKRGLPCDGSGTEAEAAPKLQLGCGGGGSGGCVARGSEGAVPGAAVTAPGRGAGPGPAGGGGGRGVHSVSEAPAGALESPPPGRIDQQQQRQQQQQCHRRQHIQLAQPIMGDAGSGSRPPLPQPPALRPPLQALLLRNPAAAAAAAAALARMHQQQQQQQQQQRPPPPQREQQPRRSRQDGGGGEVIDLTDD